MNLPTWIRTAIGKLLELDLARWGLTALAIAAVAFFAGRCSVYYGGRQADRAQATVDSARIAQQVAHERDSVHARAFAREHRRIADSLAGAEQAQPVRIVRTTIAAAGLQDALAALRAATAELPELRALVDTAQRRADSLTHAMAGERAGAATTLRLAHEVIHTDSLELERRATRIHALEGDVAAGLDREEKLVKKLRGGWTLGVTIGPGGSLTTSPVRLRGAPIQVTVGATHELHLPCLNPFGCRRP